MMARGLILFGMQRFCLTALFLIVPVAAQAQDDVRPPIVIEPPEFEMPQPSPQAPPPLQRIPEVEPDTETDETLTLDIPGEDIAPEVTEPDYSKLPPAAEREARLGVLFERLAAEEDADTANLIAEEIWAIWLDSGSASVNLVLRRGSDAQSKGDTQLARRLFNHTTDLSPEFAEGWARSSRLALERKNYNRALNESIRALTLEPRHFYALWTMGNVLEVLNRPEEALEAYREASRLYPELKAVKDRLETMVGEVEGTVL